MLALVVSTSLLPLRSKLFANLGRKISASGDDSEGAFLLQRVSVLVQCYSATLSCHMTPCQPLTAQTDDLYPIVYYLNFNSPGNISTKGKK